MVRIRLAWRRKLWFEETLYRFGSMPQITSVLIYGTDELAKVCAEKQVVSFFATKVLQFLNLEFINVSPKMCFR